MEDTKLNENLIVNTKLEDSSICESQMSDLIIKKESDYIKADIQTLKEMGYNKKMINKVYIILKPENIERAIDIMTPINGIYHHDFYHNNNKKNTNLCFICNQPKYLHTKYSNELTLKKQKKKFQKMIMK